VPEPGREVLSGIRDLLPLLEQVAKSGKPLPEDMAVLLGGDMISEDLGLKPENETSNAASVAGRHPHDGRD